MPDVWRWLWEPDERTSDDLKSHLSSKVSLQKCTKSSLEDDCMQEIFISYRREDSDDITGRIYDGLKRAFGEGHIYLDVASNNGSVDFRQAMNTALSQCKIMLIIIGPMWASISDAHTHTSRLQNPNDFVRIEVETALTQNIPVFPILVRNATMPAVSSLPSSIDELCYRHAQPVSSSTDFDHHIDRIIEYIKRRVPNLVRTPLIVPGNTARNSETIVAMPLAGLSISCCERVNAVD